jgi:uncharacterized membrane protein YfcA
LIISDIILLAIAAVAVGLASSMLGIGGGSMIVPILTLIFGLEIHQAIGTSLFSVIFMSISSSIAYSRQKRIDYLLCLLLAVGTIPGGMIGAYATKFVDSSKMIAIFGAVLIFVAFRFLKRKKKPGSNVKSVHRGWRRIIIDSMGEKFEYNANVYLGVVFSLLGGFVAGFLGLGGGSIMVPVLRLIVGLPMHLAVSASMFIMVLTSISGSLIHLNLGNIQPQYALPVMAGMVLGAQIGARFARRTSGKHLQAMFGLLLLIIGVRMILTIFT